MDYIHNGDGLMGAAGVNIEVRLESNLVKYCKDDNCCFTPMSHSPPVSLEALN